jgi:hypothetical protein
MQTLSELSQCFQLYAVCEPCQRVARLNLEQLLATEGPEYPLDRVRMRLYCRQCRTRSRALRIVYVGPKGRTADFRWGQSQVP